MADRVDLHACISGLPTDGGWRRLARRYSGRALRRWGWLHILLEYPSHYEELILHFSSINYGNALICCFSGEGGCCDLGREADAEGGHEPVALELLACFIFKESPSRVLEVLLSESFLPERRVFCFLPESDYEEHHGDLCA